MGAVSQLRSRQVRGTDPSVLKGDLGMQRNSTDETLQSSHDPTLRAGLGETGSVVSISPWWPSCRFPASFIPSPFSILEPQYLRLNPY